MSRWVGFVLLAWLILFILMNLTPREIFIFFGISVTMPMALALIFAALLGAVSALMMKNLRTKKKKS